MGAARISGSNLDEFAMNLDPMETCLGGSECIEICNPKIKNTRKRMCNGFIIYFSWEDRVRLLEKAKFLYQCKYIF
tara:strand:+ start:209 stop:436 length:228 start_codon:yes stop_codon:yes gene_type:complete